MSARHFKLLIAGDNPEELIKKYSPSDKREKHLVYKLKEAEMMRRNAIKSLEKIIKGAEENADQDPKMARSIISYSKVKKEYLEGIDAAEFYEELTRGYEIDEQTGDAYAYGNPDAKFDSAQLGGMFSLPLIKKDGTECYTCMKCEVDWEKVHMTDPRAYEFAWDSVMKGKKAKTDEEKNIYENMKNRKAYFEFYKTRENYVKSNTAFWAYAFLSEPTGWVEIGRNEDQCVWVSKFFDKFVAPLNGDVKLSVYECIRAEK